MPRHCYLDRRYFEIVLRDHGCDTVLDHPMYLNLIETPDGSPLHYNIQWDYCTVNPNKISVGCVVLRSQYLRHSTAIFVDPLKKKVWWWNPYYNEQGTSKIHERFMKINDAARRLLENYFQLYGFQEFEQLDDGVENICVKGCSESGFCNAYVLKYALDWVEGQEFDGGNILNFADEIEDEYATQLPEGEPEMEFGPGGALIGGLGGMMIGGAIGGTGGALIGGLGGAALGSSMHDKEQDFNSRGDGALMDMMADAAIYNKNDKNENSRDSHLKHLRGEVIEENSREGVVVGGLGGAAIGGIVAGPIGLLAGGLTGAVVGGAVTHHKEIRDHSRSEARY